jgi:hypothetical protein
MGNGHILGRNEKHDPSNQAARTHALDRAATVITVDWLAT